ncbi:MAG: hypothetical protein DHS20C01_31080 [marine bacterium B5-7]|nr:MAG: hypothetical protein DHS20C01_31080 [marine bacterium B5-7]
MPDIRILTDDEMAQIDLRQKHQQIQWKALPEQGHIQSFQGMELLVLPGIFPPKDDTNLLAAYVCIESGSRVLDIGTGTGALALWAAQNDAASVIAVDIAEAAVGNAKRNVERLEMENRVEVRSGNTFSCIAPAESFDIIIANLPGRNKPADDDASAAQWDTEFKAHKALFAGAKHHLRPGGRIYMVKANYPDLLEMIDLAECEGYEVAFIGQSDSASGDPRHYHVLSISVASQGV